MSGRFSVDAVFRAVDRVTAPVRRMQRAVSRFTRSARRGLDSVGKSAIGLGKNLAKIGAGAAGVGAAGVTALIVGLNDATTEATILAKAVNADVESLEALGAISKRAGLDMNNVVDLYEEMNNKLGETIDGEPLKEVQEALEFLKVDFKDIEKLSPDKQFNTIMNAAIRMGKSSEEAAAVAASAVDRIFGGEANKLLGVFIQTGDSVEDLTDKYKQLNFLTEEGRGGALDFTNALSSLMIVIISIGKQIAGLVGRQLAPMIDRLVEWVKANKDLIAVKIVDFVKDTVEWFGKLKDVMSEENNVASMVKSLKTVLTVLKGIADTIQMIIDGWRQLGELIGVTAGKIKIGIDQSEQDGFLKSWKDTFDGLAKEAQKVDEFFGLGSQPVNPLAPITNIEPAFLDDDELIPNPDFSGGVSGVGENRPPANKDKVEVTLNDNTTAGVSVNTNTLGNGLKMNHSGGFV